MKFLIILLLMFSATAVANDIIYNARQFHNIDKNQEIKIDTKDSLWESQILNLKKDSPFESYNVVKAFKISNNYNTGIFKLFSKNSYESKFYLVNFDNNQNIISSIEFEELVFIKNKYVDTKLPTLLTINKNEIFYFIENTINSYAIDSKGVITEKYSLEINSVWDMTLIDDYFPSLKHIFLYLPFDIKKQQNIMKNILLKLDDLKSFGIFSKKEFNSHLFIDELVLNCNNLNKFICGYKTSAKDINKLKENCSELKSIQVIFRYSNVNKEPDIVNSKYFREFEILEIQ